MTLVHIISQYDEKVDEKTKAELVSYGDVGPPLMELEPFEEVVKKLRNSGKKTAICSVRLGDLWGDGIYNRTHNINYLNIARYIKKYGGYDPVGAGILTAYLRPDGRLVLTQGNHRASMKYATCLDRNARISVKIVLHDENITYGEMIRIESADHSRDCNDRTSQSTDDRFRSAFYAGESWAKNLHWYVQPFGINIAGTNPSGKYGTTSYSKIAAARKFDESSCTRYLKAFTTVVDTEKDIMGYATFSATVFLRSFRESINYVDEANDIDSVTGFIDYIYNNRYNLTRKFGKNVTQQKLSEGSTRIKSPEIGVARLISLYNEYCENILEAKIPTANKHAIGYSSSEYKTFLDKTNSDLRIRVDEIAKNLF